MASTIKVDKIDPNSGTALEIGTSGDTVTVPSGVGLTLTNSTLLLPTTITSTTEVKTNKISPATGVAFALGDSGDTFTVPSGATIANLGTATGFGTPGYTLIKEVDASDVAAVTFEDGTASVVFDSTYKVYFLTMTNVLMVGDEALFLRALSGGTPLASASTYWTGLFGTSGSPALPAAYNDRYEESFWGSSGDVESTVPMCGWAYFYNAGVSSTFPMSMGQIFLKEAMVIHMEWVFLVFIKQLFLILMVLH